MAKNRTSFTNIMHHGIQKTSIQIPIEGPAAAFGKLTRDQDGKVVAWLPLVDHLLDVATCFASLCTIRGVCRSLDCAAGRKLAAPDLARLTVLAFLHDLGKANSGFQAKRWPRGAVPAGWPKPCGHGLEGRMLFTDEPFLEPLQARLPLSAMEVWGEATATLLVASLSHHGRPIVAGSADWARAIWRPVQDRDGNTVYDPAPILGLIGETALALYPDAFVDGAEPLPEAPAFGHLFAGLIQLADWIGSDTAHFPLSNGGEDRARTAPGYAERALTALGFDADGVRADLKRRAPTFAQVFDNPPYPIQSAASAPELGSLVILEAETGSGKTEAALWRFVHLLRCGAVDSLYFALPTRVSASQIYERVRRAAARLWPLAPPLTVRALPGYAAADGQEPRALPDFTVLWPDDPGDAEAHRRWAAEAPKRFLAAPIAVGTIDQALLGALQVRHAHLRQALLARSLLVVDEVHASDPYMTVLLEQVLKAQLGCGGHALLLSATLGASGRERYLALARRTRAAFPDLQSARAVPYPAVSDVRSLRAVAVQRPAKTVSWSLVDALDDPRRISDLACTAAAAGARVLILRNTVGGALAVFRVLEARAESGWLFRASGVATLHHSRFSREDRPVLDAAIEAQLGKDRPSGPFIVVGTQTLEQSLDLDADLLITDLCPVDVLLQRIGRLHRHTRGPDARPGAYAAAQTCVLTPAGHDLTALLATPRHGLGRRREGGGVYADLRAVEATRRLIAERALITIPVDNRALVEAATHPECLQAIEALSEDWQRLGQALAGDTAAERTIARLHALDIDTPFDAQQAFPDEVDIATRLGVRDRLLTFDPAPSGPFGVPLRHLPVRHFLIPPGLDSQALPTAVRSAAGTTEFALGPARFRYSRLGLEKIEDETPGA